eukprot:GHVN01083828.1.p1 GENE.GHVN01083828.1~~GHVN01083828.1.p1  ORF type:complete len:236 (+),score=20.58 GHVN01083828.1:56-763(+)
MSTQRLTECQFLPGEPDGVPGIQKSMASSQSRRARLPQAHRRPHSRNLFTTTGIHGATEGNPSPSVEPPGTEWRVIRRPSHNNDAVELASTAPLQRSQPLPHTIHPVREEQKESDEENNIGVGSHLLPEVSSPPTSRKCSAWKGLGNVFRKNIFMSCMMIFIPGAYVIHFVGCPDWANFTANFIAIIPLAWLLGKATEDLSEQIGQVIGGLLNATCGNIVEMLVVIAGLRQVNEG